SSVVLRRWTCCCFTCAGTGITSLYCVWEQQSRIRVEGIGDRYYRHNGEVRMRSRLDKDRMGWRLNILTFVRFKLSPARCNERRMRRRRGQGKTTTRLRTLARSES